MQAAIEPHHSPTSMEGERISLLMLFVLVAAHLPSMEAVQGGRDEGARSQAFISFAAKNKPWALIFLSALQALIHLLLRNP